MCQNNSRYPNGLQRPLLAFYIAVIVFCDSMIATVRPVETIPLPRPSHHDLYYSHRNYSPHPTIQSSIGCRRKYVSISNLSICILNFARRGAKRASPVKYAVGVFSVNTLFTSCHKINARNTNNTRHSVMRRVQQDSQLQKH